MSRMPHTDQARNVCVGRRGHSLKSPLQLDIGVKNATTGQTRHLSSLEDRIDESEIMGTVRREKKSRSESQRKKAEDSPDISVGPEDHAESAKDGKSSRKESETSSQGFKQGKKSKYSKKTQ